MPSISKAQVDYLKALSKRGSVTQDNLVISAVSTSPKRSGSEEAQFQLAMHQGFVAEHNGNRAPYCVGKGGLGNVPGSIKKKIINGSGFMEGTSVTYTPPGVMGTIGWVKPDDREIKQFVIHSFGHPWHAYQVGDKWKGRMNESGGAVQALIPKDNISQLVYVASGTAVDQGMSNPERFVSGFSSALNANDSTVGAHYFIDRLGNLYVVADCNDIINSSLELSNTCLSVVLEEAFYSEQEISPASPATWLPDNGGTAGTLQAFDFSPSQFLTLSILIKKLQLVYPNLRTTDHSTSIGSVGPSQNGYVLHGHIRQTKNVDPLPHFSTEEEWEALFGLVNSHNLKAEDVFVAPLTGAAARTWWVASLPVPTSQGQDAVSSMVASEPTYAALALIRASGLAGMRRSDYNLSAGSQATEDSKDIKQRSANRQALGTSAIAPTQGFDEG